MLVGWHFFLKKFYIMAIKIRLARCGRKSSPHYSIVVIESTRKQTGKFIEKIGHYHPLKLNDDANRIVVDGERVKYWIGVGAIPTEAIIKFMKILKIDGVEKFKLKSANPELIGKSKDDIAAMKKAQKDALIAAKKAKEEAKKVAAKALEESQPTAA